MEQEEIHYYPCKPFFAFWQERRLQWTKTVSEKGTEYRSYHEDGWLERVTIEKPTGEKEYRSYYPNCQIREREIDNEHGYSRFNWDLEGEPLGGVRYDRDTRTEMRFHPNGKLKIRHNRTTGAYEEYFPDGKLKRKGTWADRDGEKAYCLSSISSRFVTGNMLAKSRDENRQEYIEAIDAINGLPPTAGRKIAKQALAKAYQDSCRSRS